MFLIWQKGKISYFTFGHGGLLANWSDYKVEFGVPGDLGDISVEMFGKELHERI